jgi:hypothetical protein
VRMQINHVLHDAIIGAWNCALAGARVVYLSGPITTGRRYVQYMRSFSSGAPSDLVLKQNISDLLSTAARLRSQRIELIVEPASLHLPDWSQEEYYRLWEVFLERHAQIVILMPGWEYSGGCATEFLHAVGHDIRTESLSGANISIEDGTSLLRSALEDLRQDDARGSLAGLADKLAEVIRKLERLRRPAKVKSQELSKSKSLDLMAERGMNVAQFISFVPDQGRPVQEFSRVAGRFANERFPNLHTAIETLLRASADGSVNVRSYAPRDPQSREFIYGLNRVEEVVSLVERLSGEGLHTIVNETVDVRDGGVSGVLQGNLLEFSPDDTPRCVEKPGTALLPRGLGRELLATVYGFPIELDVPFASRLEFSLHPRPRGLRGTNVLLWEFSEKEQIESRADIVWPNNFSRLIGDKTFGLLVAYHLGLRVPLTTVVNRRVAPFTFGTPTGWHEFWLRTAPLEQVPGLFSTCRGWTDPFSLMQREDGTGSKISSVLSQAGVYPAYSGALLVGDGGRIIIEGRSGTGDTLMLGVHKPEMLPDRVLEDVRDLYRSAEAVLGPVRLEWVHNGEQAWVVQLHKGATETSPHRLTGGSADHWVEFDVSAGLPALRSRLAALPQNTGIILKGRVGLTSHISDVVRRAKVPAIIAN